VANHPSAIKRARQNEDRRERNKTAKTRVKNVIKSVHTAAGSDMDPEALATKQLNEAKSIIAKSAKKAAIHRRAASRKISRLERRVNAVKK